MARKKYMVGNWKMNQNIAEIKAFVDTVGKARSNIKCEAWIAPQFVHVPLLKELCSKHDIQVGGQNCSHKPSGAFTGDVAPSALKEIGSHFVIIGHSERRTFFKESDEIINEKVHLALNAGLKVIFCVGETLEEREKGITETVVKTQIDGGLKNLPKEEQKNIIIAYEPVWAIGTGKVATPQQAGEAHQIIRKYLGEKHSFVQDEVIILYGGSVKPDNIDSILAMPDIDGGLVGGASLKADDYVKLCLSASK